MKKKTKKQSHTKKQLQDILELQRGLTSKEKPRTVQEMQVDFLQTIGPVIPLCWIPAPDVEALIKFLDSCRPPDDVFRVIQAQSDAIVHVLHRYLREAEERNNQPSSMTFTYADKEKK